MRQRREDGRFLILLDAFAFCLTKIKRNTRRSFKNCKKGRKERKTIQRCTETAHVTSKTLIPEDGSATPVPSRAPAHSPG